MCIRDRYSVGAAGYARVQGQPACIPPHELHHENEAVGAGGGVDIVDNIGGDIHGALEAEGGVCAVDVVVYGLGPVSYTHLDVYKRQGFGVTSGIRATAGER